MASLFLTLTGDCFLVCTLMGEALTLVGEALSRFVLGVHLFCVGTVRRDMLSSMWK